MRYRYNWSWNFYKRSAALQVSLILPTVDIEDNVYTVKRHGCLFLEAAPGLKDQENAWDWEQKVKFSIAPSDLLLIEKSLQDGQDPKLVHEYKEKVSTCLIRQGTGKYENTYMLQLSSEGRNVSVPLTRPELQAILLTMKSLLPELLGWRSTGLPGQ